MRIGPHQFDTAGATLGDGLVFGPDVDEVVYGPVVQGLASADASVVVTDNGDGTFDLAATATGGELLMADGVTSPPVPIETEAGDDWLYQD